MGVLRRAIVLTSRVSLKKRISFVLNLSDQRGTCNAIAVIGSALLLRAYTERFTIGIILGASIATAFFVAHSVVVFIFNPVQDRVFPGLSQYLSLVFLPHGVKVLATAAVGASPIYSSG